MPDMLVKLYELPLLQPQLEQQLEHNIIIRRVIVAEKHFVLAWVKQHFSDYWISETDVAFTRQPASCFIATQEGEIIGFACYDVTAKGFFGPTGVSEQARGKGTGKALLIATLHDMFAQGYGYGIIGGVGPADFYNKSVGATLIPDSSPGLYAGMLEK